MAKLFDAIKDAILNPTIKQKEAYGRLFHTLSAAGFIGAVTVSFTETQVSVYNVVRVAILPLVGVLFLIAGALLSKGE